MAEESLTRRGALQQDPLRQWHATCDYQVTAGAVSDTAGPMTSFCPQQQLGGHTASHFFSP